MIRAENIKKYYGSYLALDDVSFNIEKGEIVGLLGLNGAGKTTLMRILTGFFAPNHGDIWVANCNMLTQSLEARRYIGYLPEIVPLYTDMTVRSYLDFLSRLRGLTRDKTEQQIEKVIEICRLEDYRDAFINKLSKGYRQRVGIAQAIIHEPQVLILDEPTVGIDPIQVTMTRELIKDLGKDRTVILSTHILSEVSAICERVIIIHEGKIVAEDRIQNLSSMVSGAKHLRLELEGEPDKIMDQLNKVQGITSITYNDPYYNIVYPAETDLRGNITDIISQCGLKLLSMDSVTMSLEDIFLKLTRDEENEH